MTVLEEVITALRSGDLINPECVCECGRPKSPRADQCDICYRDALDAAWRESLCDLND